MRVYFKGGGSATLASLARSLAFNLFSLKATATASREEAGRLIGEDTTAVCLENICSRCLHGNGTKRGNGRVTGSWIFDEIPITRPFLLVTFFQPLLSAILFCPRPRPRSFLSLSLFLPSFHFGEKGIWTLLLWTKLEGQSSQSSRFHDRFKVASVLAFCHLRWQIRRHRELERFLSASREIARRFSRNRSGRSPRSTLQRNRHRHACCYTCSANFRGGGKKLFSRSMDRNAVEYECARRARVVLPWKRSGTECHGKFHERLTRRMIY